jgi:hypothetical protein
VPEPSQNQGCLQPAQQIMKTTAGPFHFLHMRPMSDVIMLWRLWFRPCLALIALLLAKDFGRFQL